MAYRLVWLCLDIIEELEAKYGRGFMGEFDGDGVFEMFQCKVCENARIAESEGYSAGVAVSNFPESSVDWDIFLSKVRELETRISQDFR